MDGTARVVDDVGGGGVRKELKCAGDMARVTVGDWTFQSD